MSENNALRLSRVAGESDSSDFFETRIADLAVPVRLAYSAIRDLRANLPLEGDTAGFLLGASSPAALDITHCELLSPSADAKSLSEVLNRAVRARLQAPLESAPQLLGFFRAQTDGWPDIRESDLKIVRRHFRDSGALFLLIQTTEHRPWSAALFALGPGGVSGSRAPAAEFFFDEYLLRSGYSTDLALALPSPMPPEVPARQGTGWWIALAAVVIVALAGLGLYQWFLRKDRLEPVQVQVSAPSAGSLALKVNRSGKDFEVSWDRSSSAVIQASEGILTIHDGAITRSIQMNNSQLREGRILYSPLFEELSFRLEVGGDDGPTQAESVQVVAWSARSPLPSDPTTPGRFTLPAQPLLPPVTSADPKLRLPVTDTQPFKRPSAPASNGKADTKDAAQSAEHEKPQPLAIQRVDGLAPKATVSQTAATQPRPPEPVSLLRDSAIARANPSAANLTAPPERSSAREFQPAAPPAPQTSGAAAPAPVSGPSPAPERSSAPQNTSPLSTSVLPSAVGLPRTSPTAPKSAPPASTPLDHVAPIPIRRQAPAIGREVKAILGAIGGKEITVSVKVDVDTSGEVKKTDVISIVPRISGPDFYLRAAATEAAKAWRFQPGLLDGQPIATEFVVVFKFR